MRITAIPYQAYVTMRRVRARRAGSQRLKRLYSRDAGPGDLVFDVGANVGDHVSLFRSLGYRVVAVEPQPALGKRLQERFADDPDVTVVAGAASSRSGIGTITLNENHVFSSMSASYRASTDGSGRFGESSVWTDVVEVPTVTLDELIAEYGHPTLCKIDVEGFEREVLEGLSAPVRAVVIEYTQEIVHIAVDCVHRLAQLGSTEFALCLPDRTRVPRVWRSKGDIVAELLSLPSLAYGDLYARAPSAG
jgi:FkbM family methyltransferase